MFSMEHTERVVQYLSFKSSLIFDIIRVLRAREKANLYRQGFATAALTVGGVQGDIKGLIIDAPLHRRERG